MPKYDSKIVLGNFNAKVGRKEKYRPTIANTAFTKRPTTMEKD